ncbi:hypothetical protein ACHAW6_005204 [Cyclotella cf. meneghiniana]
MIDTWVYGVNSLASVATRFPHSAYAGLVSCLMAEWQYICRIVPNIGPLLQPIEDAHHTKFLKAILGSDIAIDYDLHNLLALGSILCNEPICTHHHQSAVHTAAASSQKEHCNGKDTFLHALLAHSLPKVKKCLEQAGATGAWLTTIPDCFSGTELTKTEWFDNNALRYGSRPPHLPSRCDNCGKGFTVKHVRNCKKGGLVGIGHDDARDEWAHLCSLAFSNARVVIKPTILYGNNSNPGACHAVQPTSPPSPTDTLGDESQGDVLVHGLWQCPEALSSTSASATQMPDPMPTPPPTKCWSAPPRRRSGSMNRPVSPNVETSPRLSTWQMDSHPRRPGKPSDALTAFLPPSGTTPNLIPRAIVQSNTLLLRADCNDSHRCQAPTDRVAAASRPAITPE